MSYFGTKPHHLNGIPNSLYCNICKVRTRIECDLALSNHDGTYFVIGKCIDCTKLTIMHCEVIPSDKAKSIGVMRTIPVKIKHMYPFSSETKIQDVPPKIANSYIEGIKCLDADAPNGSVAMFRRTLQQICVEKGANPKDRLVDQIKKLPPEIVPTAKEIKEWGNLGVHEDSDGKVLEVNKEQAEAIKRFLEMLFLTIYQHPAELERLKKARS